MADENREAKRKALCSLTVTWYGNTMVARKRNRGTGLQMKERFWPCENWNKSSLTRPSFRAVFVSRSIFHAAKTDNPVPRSLLRNRTETVDTQANKTSLNVMGPWFYWGIATIKEQENLGLKWKQCTT